MAKNFGKSMTNKQLLQNLAKTADQKNIKANEHNKNEIVKISIELIDESAINEEIYDMDDLEGLTDSIKENGIKNPLRVWKQPDGRYLVCAGHRRLRCAKIAGLKEVPVLIIDWESNDFDRILDLLDDNLQNRKDKPLERARALNAFINAYREKYPSMSMNDIKTVAGKRCSLSRGTMDKLLGLLKLIPELQQKAQNPDIYPYSGLAYARHLTTDEQLLFNKKIEDYVTTYGQDKLTRDHFKKFKDECEEYSKKSVEKQFENTAIEQDAFVSDDIEDFPVSVSTDRQDFTLNSKTEESLETEEKTTPVNEPKKSEKRSKTPVEMIRDSSENFISILQTALDCKNNDREAAVQMLLQVKESLGQVLEILQYNDSSEA